MKWLDARGATKRQPIPVRSPQQLLFAALDAVRELGSAELYVEASFASLQAWASLHGLQTLQTERTLRVLHADGVRTLALAVQP